MIGIGFIDGLTNQLNIIMFSDEINKSNATSSTAIKHLCTK